MFANFRLIRFIAEVLTVLGLGIYNIMGVLKCKTNKGKYGIVFLFIAEVEVLISGVLLIEYKIMPDLFQFSIFMTVIGFTTQGLWLILRNEK